MVGPKELDHPYYYCGICRVLMPVQIIGGNQICLKCGKQIKSGGRVVMLSRKEAVMRHLLTVKDSGTGELYED